jgi:serine/threonine protein kinase
MLYDMLTGSPPFVGHNRKKIMENILKKKPFYPHYMTPQAKDLCNKLLKKNPAQRLGSKGADTVKRHDFFRKIDWKKLPLKEVSPPFIPALNHDEDLAHFEEAFTKMPLESPPISNDPSLADAFKGFSFVASSEFLATLDRSGNEELIDQDVNEETKP